MLRRFTNSYGRRTERGGSGRGSGRRRAAVWPVLLGVLAVVAVVLAPSGSANPPSSGVKQYDACLQNVSPLSPAACDGSGAHSVLPGGSTAHLQLTVTNEGVSNTTLGSANLDAPAQLPIDTSTVMYAPGSSGGFGINSSSEIQLRDLNLAAGSSVTLTFDVTTPCAGNDLAWTIAAKQSNRFNGNGNDFALTLSTGLVSDIATGSCRLAWVTQPTSTTVNTLITGTPLDPTGPKVAVKAVDGSGNTLTSLNTGTVTLTKTAGTFTSSGGFTGTQATFVNGIATFDGTQLDSHGHPLNNLMSSATGSGFRLQASSPGFISTPDSDPTFAISLSGESCTTSGCPTFNTTLDGNTNVDASATGDAFTFLAIGPATAPSSVTGPGGGCANFSTVGAAGFAETDGRTGPGGDLLFTYYVNKRLIQKKYGNNNGQQFIPICAGSAQVASDGTVIPCTAQGVPYGPWKGKELDSGGNFDGNTADAVCDRTTGLYWGILGSFQDYTNSDPSKIIDPSTNPTVTGWDSNSTYRFFYVRVPYPWDFQLKG
jgi:hypothetical protein